MDEIQETRSKRQELGTKYQEETLQASRLTTFQYLIFQSFNIEILQSEKPCGKTT